MYPRTNYEMSEEDLKKILEACNPTPVLYGSGGVNFGGDSQENANQAWRALGEEMGFDYMTVRPIQGKGMRFFSAVPSETVEQKKKRLEEEAKEKRKTRIETIQKQMGLLKTELEMLLAREERPL